MPYKDEPIMELSTGSLVAMMWHKGDDVNCVN